MVAAAAAMVDAAAADATAEGGGRPSGRGSPRLSR